MYLTQHSHSDLKTVKANPYKQTYNVALRRVNVRYNAHNAYAL